MINYSKLKLVTVEESTDDPNWKTSRDCAKKIADVYQNFDGEEIRAHVYGSLDDTNWVCWCCVLYGRMHAVDNVKELLNCYWYWENQYFIIYVT